MFNTKTDIKTIAMNKKIYLPVLLLGVLVCWSLVIWNSNRLPSASELSCYPDIFPDNKESTIPFNIAPLNFTVHNVKRIKVEFFGGDYSFVVSGESIDIPLKKWRRLLEKAKGGRIEVSVYGESSDGWVKYKPFHWQVSEDAIDSHLVYRLIEPTYANWNQMGIYQRDLTSFVEKEIIANDKTGNNCMNCHTFNNGNPDELVMHMRKINPGTLVIKDGVVKKLNTRSDNTISAFVYPYWHPAGNDIAFSNNLTQMSFFEANRRTIEVYDLLSDIVIYNIERNEVYTSPHISDPEQMENLPLFSPDGSKLYFCSCPKVDSLPQQFDKLKYKLLSIGFDATRRQFASTVDTLIDLEPQGKGISLPSISPDGRFILCSVASSGCFFSWNKEADLLLYDTKTGDHRPADALNSNQAESCTTWSSNSRWVVFSSRRIDGVYNRLYIAHLDENGTFGKPFVLPQRDPSYYEYLMKAYNLPRLITGEVLISPYEISKCVMEDDPIPVQFDQITTPHTVGNKQEETSEVN